MKKNKTLVEEIEVLPDTYLKEIAKIQEEENTFLITLSIHSKKITEKIKTVMADILPDTQYKLTSVVESKVSQPNIVNKKNIKNIIAVASGKGGVGKSSTSINLAIALQQMGATVGLLDADIYGPSQPTMLGINERPESHDDKSIEPVMAYGLQTMSLGYLIEDSQATIWRAPMAVGALLQLINDTNWKSLDYLILDLPPGTGDIQLTIAQKIPVTGAVTVTTPQDISLVDARRSLDLFKKVHIENLGIVENMSTHICSQCGHEEAIFGADGGKAMADDYQIDLLGEIPLDIRIRQGLDQGLPIVVSDPDSDISQRYSDIATKVALKIAKKDKSYSQSFGKITIENK